MILEDKIGYAARRCVPDSTVQARSISLAILWAEASGRWSTTSPRCHSFAAQLPGAHEAFCRSHPASSCSLSSASWILDQKLPELGLNPFCHWISISTSVSLCLCVYLCLSLSVLSCLSASTFLLLRNALHEIPHQTVDPYSSIPACATESLKQRPNHNELLNAFALPFFFVKDEHPSPSWPPPPDTTTTSALNKPKSKEFSSNQGLQKAHKTLHHHDSSLLSKTVPFLAPLLFCSSSSPRLSPSALGRSAPHESSVRAWREGRGKGSTQWRGREGRRCCGNPSSNGWPNEDLFLKGHDLHHWVECQRFHTPDMYL